MLDQKLKDLGYVSSKSDPEKWLKAETRPDGTDYYAYVLVHVDGVLHPYHDPDTFINLLAEVYRLKDGSVGEPNRYLGDNIEKVQPYEGSVAW